MSLACMPSSSPTLLLEHFQYLLVPPVFCVNVSAAWLGEWHMVKQALGSVHKL